MGEQNVSINILELDGTVSVRQVFTVVFYIRKPHLSIAGNIERAIWSFVEMVSFDNLTRYADYEGELQPLSEGALLQLLKEEFFSPAPPPNADIILCGDDANAPEYYLRYFGNVRGGQNGYASYISFRIPPAFWEERRDQALQFVSRLADDLPFSFGYGSWALSGGSPLQRQALASRYMGLDIANPVSINLDIGDNAAGSYWLTYLGYDLCETLGGVSALREALQPEIMIEELPQRKCRIQLGPAPLLGDLNRQESLPLNQTLAKLLEKYDRLHVPRKCIYFDDREGMSDIEAQEAWHRRFLSA